MPALQSQLSCQLLVVFRTNFTGQNQHQKSTNSDYFLVLADFDPANIGVQESL
jgi:hypothetical protein